MNILHHLQAASVFYVYDYLSCGESPPPPPTLSSDLSTERPVIGAPTHHLMLTELVMVIQENYRTLLTSSSSANSNSVGEGFI